MIEPTEITKFNRSIDELNEFWLFCFMVAGKPATRIAPLLQRLLDAMPGTTVHEKILYIGEPRRTWKILEKFGIAPYKDRVPAFQVNDPSLKEGAWKEKSD